MAWQGVGWVDGCLLTCTPCSHVSWAQVVIYTRQGGQEVVWDMQWTGSEGTTSFFLVPG
jgi:hypothetical protein